MAFSVPLVVAANEEEAVRLAYDAIAMDRMGLIVNVSEEMAWANSNPNCTKREPRQSGGS